MIDRRSLIGCGVLGIAASAMLHGVARAHGQRPYPVFDAHCHLISLDSQRYPHAEKPGLFEAGGPPPPGLPNARYGDFIPVPAIADVMRWMDENGVVAGAAVQKKGTYGFDNSYILDASDVIPRRFIAVAVVNVAADDAAMVITTMAQQHHLAGIRLTGPVGKFDWFDSREARRAWAAVNERQLSVDLMAVPAGRSDELLAHYAAVARDFPRARLVLNHAAWPDPTAPNSGITDAMRRLNECGNVYWKFTTINLDFNDEAGRSSAEFLTRAVEVFGANRLMWGSDIGNSAGTYSLHLARMDRALAGLSVGDVRAVMHDTAVEAYRFA